MCRSLLWETTDARNRHFFGGKLENETINGWGYDRVMLRELGPMSGTRMAADPNVYKVHRFIAPGGAPPSSLRCHWSSSRTRRWRRRLHTTSAGPAIRLAGRQR